ncbi:MAG: AlbA family DNA-binding domain-containing protein [Candidatus Entotheonellia bacterium]
MIGSLALEERGLEIKAFAYIRTSEYANAVVAASLLHYVFGFPTDDGRTPEENHQRATREVQDLARICLSYLNVLNQEVDKLAHLIAAGESKRLEFKSTLRWDLKQSRQNPELSHAVLKTIAAFLNTDGGTLLVGIADDGTPIGIEKDQFPNDDKFSLHLMNLVKSSIGEVAATFVEMAFIKYRDVRVARVDCRPSPSPVYLRPNKGQHEEFYVRMGPGSTPLGPRELVTYIRERFPNSVS